MTVSELAEIVDSEERDENIRHWVSNPMLRDLIADWQDMREALLMAVGIPTSDTDVTAVARLALKELRLKP